MACCFSFITELLNQPLLNIHNPARYIEICLTIYTLSLLFYCRSFINFKLKTGVYETAERFCIFIAFAQ
jgi:hypothetical protein